MSYLKITVETDSAHSDTLAEFFNRFSAASVSFSAASDEPIFDYSDGEETGQWRRTYVSALLHVDVDLDILMVCMRDCLGAEHIYSSEVTPLVDQDWVASYQQQQQALIFSDQLCICPSWCEPPAGEFNVIRLDPGLAFGTGSHATTALCLEWLAKHDLQGRSVIDFGCGSGILALAAASLGAGQVIAVDIDQQALKATQENAEKNQLQSKLRISHVDEIELPQADILVANVLLNPLLSLTDLFENTVRQNGQLVLSGLLPDQVEACLAAYQGCFNMQPAVFKDEWALIEGVRI